MSTYYDILDAVAKYYGRGSDQWVEIAKKGISAENAEAILKQVPNVEIIKNADGSIRSWAYNSTGYASGSTNIGSVGNSNSLGGTTNLATKTQIKIPANTTIDTGGKVSATSGLKTAGKFVTGTVLPAIAAAGIGITLGKTIDKTLYNINPDFWDSHGMSTLNPDTWNMITQNDESLNARLFNMVFGIDNDNKATQGYLDETALAYMALYMQQQGVFSESNIYKPVKTDLTYNLPEDVKIIKTDVLPISIINFNYSPTLIKDYTYKCTNPNKANNSYILAFTPYESGYYKPRILTPDIYHDNPQKCGSPFIAVTPNPPDFPYGIEMGAGKKYSKDGVNYIGIGLDFYKEPSTRSVFEAYDYTSGNYSYYLAHTDARIHEDLFPALWELFYGAGMVAEEAIKGISNQENGKIPKLDETSTVDEVLIKLKEQYPELWEKSVTQEVIQPDGSIKEYNYVPITMPEIDSPNDTQPTSGTKTQIDTSVKPDNSTSTLLDSIKDIISKIPTNPNPPDTGSGKTPTPVIPLGSTNALFSIYNPSQLELNQLGGWLWSSNFVDQLLKVFSNPMDAIIGLHKVFANPIISGRSTIRVGYLDSGVESNLVANQYTSINCGYVDIQEYFGNVLDYDPYTKISLYLPFIGIVPLNVSEVMRSTITVTYHIDVLTGACLAEVNIQRDSVGGILYTYSGNCAVQYPISSGSYMGIVSGIVGIAGSIVGTVATGGALAPMIAGSVVSAMHMKTNVSHSGSLSGNSGAMGIKIPYIIITRPQTAMAEHFNEFQGYPSNYYVALGSCKGFVKVKSVHIDGINATDEEKNMIEELLKNGVFV